jgi:hypothetical protein
MRPGGTTATHRTEELQRKSVGPLSVVEREKIPAYGGAGVVDQYVDAPEARQCRRDQRSGCASVLSRL